MLAIGLVPNPAVGFLGGLKKRSDKQFVYLNANLFALY